MIKYSLDACFATASSLSDVQDRMTVLINLLNAPAKFYAEDIGASSGMIQILKHAHLIMEVPGKTKETFICVNEDEELYRRVPVKCWRLTLDRKSYREDLVEYVKKVADVFAPVLVLTTTCSF